ncbi:uncharacterized protein B0P05DRAFT_447114, partial [Gilbertella persicaria]|uniref:uncharacterized protein n=1 Tax=Gilbertella persicaria TaxID=101096 RepID=UPI00221F298B
QFEAQVVAAASLLIIFGAALMLTGFMLFRVTIILTGVLLGSAIAWIGLQVNEPATSYPNTSTLYLGVCIGVGLVLGAFLMIFYRIGMYVLVG